MPLCSDKQEACDFIYFFANQGRTENKIKYQVYQDTKADLILTVQLGSTLCMSYSNPRVATAEDNDFSFWVKKKSRSWNVMPRWDSFFYFFFYTYLVTRGECWHTLFWKKWHKTFFFWHWNFPYIIIFHSKLGLNLYKFTKWYKSLNVIVAFVIPKLYD